MNTHLLYFRTTQAPAIIIAIKIAKVVACFTLFDLLPLIPPTLLLFFVTTWYVLNGGLESLSDVIFVLSNACTVSARCVLKLCFIRAGLVAELLDWTCSKIEI